MLFYTRADLDEKEQEQTAAEQLSKKMEVLKLNSSPDTAATTTASTVANNEKDLDDSKAEVIMKDMVKTNGDSKMTTAIKKLGSKTSSKIPLPIEKSIQKQNVRFLHHRNQYSPEFFQVRL